MTDKPIPGHGGWQKPVKPPVGPPPPGLPSKRSAKASQIMRDVIQVRGLSYERAIRFCEAQAEREAAPWREVAAELRSVTEKLAR